MPLLQEYGVVMKLPKEKIKKEAVDMENAEPLVMGKKSNEAMGVTIKKQKPKCIQKGFWAFERSDGICFSKNVRK